MDDRRILSVGRGATKTDRVPVETTYLVGNTAFIVGLLASHMLKYVQRFVVANLLLGWRHFASVAYFNILTFHRFSPKGVKDAEPPTAVSNQQAH
tara:strand:- start:765 stop:1049 length:285 start_codon:yes stop_codon:yes gene_type:complete